MATNNIKKRGFGSLSKEKRSLIASSGGKRAHQLKRAHQWTKEEAQQAGRKGGAANFHKTYEKRIRLLKNLNQGESG